MVLFEAFPLRDCSNSTKQAPATKLVESPAGRGFLFAGGPSARWFDEVPDWHEKEQGKTGWAMGPFFVREAKV